MNEKLSLQDLIDLLAHKAQISKKESDLFLREFFQLILEQIYENDFVKIKDFGTFKLTLISSRESVNVNTGKKIEIPSHFRLGFHPDKTLKDLVNLPYSRYEAIILEDGVDPLDIVFEEKESDNNEENNIDISENIVKKTIENQVDLINEFRNKNVKITDDSTPSQTKNKNTASNDLSQDIDIVKPASFVYSYVTTLKNEEENDNTIILVIPKDNFVISVDTEILDTLKPEVGDNLSSNNNVFDNDETQDETDILEEDEWDDDNQNQDVESDAEIIEDDDDKNVIVTELVLDTSSEEESIIEIIDSTELSIDDNNPDIENHNEVDIDKDLLVSSVRNDVVENIKEAEDLSTFQFLSEDDPERPLLPLENNQEKNRTETVELYSNSKNSNKVSKSKTSQDMEKPNIDTQNETDDDSFFYQSQPSFKDKIKKRLPFILIIGIALAFAIYSFAKLFDVKYDYERYLGNKNLTLADTLPLMGNDNMSVIDSTDELVTTKTTPDILQVPISDKADLEGKADTSESVNAVSTGIILDGTNDNTGIDSTSFYINKNSKRFSRNLNFNIINKAQFFVQKNVKSELQTPTTEKNSQIVNPKDVVTISLQKGMTLRSLAGKYFGNSIYWVYIYEANRSILPNPNTLSIGMKLIIPDLSQYGITDRKDKEAIKKAQQLEIKYL